MASADIRRAKASSDAFPTLNKAGDRGSRFIQFAEDAKEDLNHDLDCLSAEFRHKLGLLPEEEQELSDIFKAKLGLSPLDKHRLHELIEDKDRTAKQYSIEKYALNHFQTQQTAKKPEVKFINGQLSNPLLPKESPAETQASIYLFAAIKLFMDGDFPIGGDNSIRTGTAYNTKPYMPVMMKVFQVLDSFYTDESPSPTNMTSTPFNQSEKPLEEKPKKPKNKMTIRKLIRTIGKAYSKRTSFSSASRTNDFNEHVSSRKSSSSSSNHNSSGSNYHNKGYSTDAGVTYENVMKSLVTELDVVQFVVSHGIIRRELRWKICFLVFLLAMARAWILHSLCISCFLPSSQLIGYYISFLHRMSDTSPIVIDRIFQNILRTNENGFRYHPSNSLELKSELMQTPIIFQVSLIDGRMIKVAVDSSCTSLEVCTEIARQINLEDSFGFSLFISIYERVSSLGCGSDHIMDALTECEHMARDRGIVDESEAPWMLFFRKELFTPWFDPKLDLVSSKLIYKQIHDGFLNGEYNVPHGILETFIAQILFVEYGRLRVELIRQNIPNHVPTVMVSDSKSLQSMVEAVYKVTRRLALDTDDNEKNEVMNSIITSASQFLSMNFSALFEAVNYGGFPQLQPQEVVIALNGCGVTIHSSGTMLPLAYFKFSDLMTSFTNNAQDITCSTLTMVAIDGVEYSLVSPNSEVASKIIIAFLSGLRRRSRWAIAVKPFVFKDFRKNREANEFQLIQGDTVELLDEIVEGTLNRHESRSDILYGICERTGLKGYFPIDVVYVLPTAQRPAQEFLDLLREMGKEVAQSTLTHFTKSRVIMEDADTIKRHPDSSA
ncbi:hypothetical protein HELRODRAFT_189721 [Helobdella robusta]|uniref:MyTH4 domain-containing protein n=1 Tax=Helobdella robusta TaxID=6412 RepID=T1FRA6_HELRO|nr:hypothetical protein HELRODRAFT_189721 [Helobdella robusta]ESN91554.1 hypothetical protein HELRODRAFT_189721 [Helobdella robusta]